MLARTAFLLALVYALGQPLPADAQDARRCQNIAEQQQLTLAEVCPPDARTQRTQGGIVILQPGTDDIIAGHGPEADTQILRQIAIYDSVGNRAEVEILTSQLRASGVTKERINEAVTWAKLHAAPSNPLTAQPLFPAADASQ